MEKFYTTIASHYQSWYFVEKSGNIFSSRIRKSLLYGYETWPASSETIRRLSSADNGVVRWICGVRLEQRIRTQEIHEKLGIISVAGEIRWRRLRYFGHLQGMDKNVWPRRVNDYLGFFPERVRNFVGVMLLQKTSKISTSGKNLLTNE